MSSNKKFYKVLTDTHTHEGQPVPKGAVIELEPEVAASMKDVFQETAAPKKATDDEAKAAK